MVGGRTSDGANQISVLAAKNLKLTAYIFKLMEHCSKVYDIRCVNSTFVLQHQHQWELEQKKTDGLKVPKVTKDNLANTVENIVLYLKLMRGVRGTPLVYVVWHHIKVAHILPEYSAYLNLDKEMIARAHIVDAKLNLKMTEECLDRVYLSHQCDTKIDNTLVYCILLKVFTDMDAYVNVEQRKSTQVDQAVFFDIHKQFLSSDHVARQATETERKL